MAAVFLLQLLEEVDGAGDGHGDFDDGDAAGNHGFDDGVRLGFGFLARRTGMRPTRSMISAVGFGMDTFSIARCGADAALHGAFDFSECGHAGVAGGGHGQRAVGHAAADGPVDGFAGEQAVDEAGGKAVATANAVEDVDVALGDVDDLVLIERDGTPGVAAGGVRGAEGAGDELEIWIGGGHFAQHLFVACDGQFGEVFADAFDLRRRAWRRSLLRCRGAGRLCGPAHG